MGSFLSTNHNSYKNMLTISERLKYDARDEDMTNEREI